MTKRLFAMLLVLVMVLSMMPTSVWAEGAGTPAPQTEQTTAEMHTLYTVQASHDHVANDAHICEHCVAAGKTGDDAKPTWNAWGDDEAEKTKLPTASGHYYIVGDLNKMATSDLSSGSDKDVVICLNGKSLNCNDAYSASNRFYTLGSTNKLTVLDCTAHVDADGNYMAGAFNNGTYSSFFYTNATTNKAVLTIYDGIINNSTRRSANQTAKQAGGAICVQGPGTVNIYGGMIQNCSASSGGAVYFYSKGATLNMDGGILKNNYATGNSSGDPAYGTAICFSSSGTGSGTNTANITGGVITGNTSTRSGADCCGAFFFSTTTKVNLGGNVQIIGNTDKDGNANNLYLTNAAGNQPKLNISGLDSAARVGIYVKSERLSAADGLVLSTALNETIGNQFVADNEGYAVKTVDGVLTLVKEGPHAHKVCNNDTACPDCAHTDVTYRPWGNNPGEDTSLPTTGDYYLTTDVTLSKQVDLDATNLNLCLNGHTIKTASGVSVRHFMLSNNAQLVISNCDENNDGILTGGKASSIMNKDVVNDAPSVELYNVVLKGNSYANGGAIMLQRNATLKAVSCRFVENTGTSSAGAIRFYGAGTQMLVNCQFTDNSAPTMAAIRQDNGHVTLIDTVITDNHSTNKAGDASYGAYYLVNTNGKTLTVAGATRITGNTDKDGKAVNLFFQNTVGNQGRLTIGQGGLTDGALIGITLQAARLGAADGMTITTKLNGANPVAHFASDDDAYMPVLKDDVVILGSVAAYTHKHVICADSGCTDHAEVNFLPWGDNAGEETSLPATGDYYLTKDVTLSAQVKPTGTLNLCLNGHTVTVKEGSGTRHFYLENNAQLAITNCDTAKDGVLTGGEKSSIMSATNATGATIELYNIVLLGNEYQSGGGGALMTQSSTNATLVNCKLLNNSATGVGGAIRHYGSGTVTLIDCEVKGNTARSSSAIRVENGKGKLVLIDTVIEGNSTTTTETLDYGALFAPNNTYVITVEGETRITGNTDKNGNASNVFFQNSADKQGVLTIGDNGLSGNALIGVGMDMARVYANDNVISANAVAAGTEQYFTGDDAELNRVIRNADDGKLYLAGNHADHALCLNADCTAHSEHAGEVWLPWKKTASLPTSGNFYLTKDVQLNGVHNMQTAGTLNLCLNGHKITAKSNERIFALVDGVNLFVTDCTGDGKLTGGNRAFGGGVINVNAGATFSLYAGNVTGNKAVKNADGRSDGGVVYLTPAKDGLAGGIFNMYGGKIFGNSSEDLGGAIFVDTGATANIYAGEIYENEANRGGALYVKGTANISGGKISGNIAANRAAAIFLSGGTLNLSGGEISGHEAKTAIVAASKATINMTGGKITENVGGSGGAIIMESAGTKMTMSGGAISGNSASSGAGIFVSTNTIFEMTGGVISGNTAKNTGGGIHLLRSKVTLAGGEIKNNTAGSMGAGVEIEGATVTLSGTKITGNAAGNNGGGMYIASTTNNDVVYKPTVTLAGGEISGNTAANLGGGVMVKDTNFEKLELSGNLVIDGNRAGNKTSNLYLPGKAVFTVGEMGENAKVGISAARVYGSMSQKTEKDCTAAFFSDNSALKVVYKDSTVYLQPADGHTHCVCLDQDPDCKHEATAFAAWSDPTKLPTTPGNYYLTVDVQLKAVCSLSADVNLCLNGHTITPTKNERTFALRTGYTLSVTDCTDKGIITGGVRDYGGVINVNQGATFNLYGGNLTGNTNETLTKENGKAGAIYLTKASEGQPGGVFNMYGGAVSNNVAFWGGAVYVCAGATANIYGGTMADNQAMDRGGAIAGESKGVINVYGGVMTGNYAGKGGALYVNGAHINMTGGTITKNKTGATTYQDKTINKGSGAAAISLTNGSTMVMSGGEISYNEGKGAGGAMLIESKNTKFTMTGGKFIGNTTPSDGGAIYVSKNTVFEMSGGEIIKNTAKNGGGVYFLQSTGTITGGKINNNTVREGVGGGIGMARATVTMKGGSVSYNVNKKDKSPKAAGIQMNGSTFNMYGGTIVGNYSVAKGSGMAITTSTASETKDGVKTTYYTKINMYGGTISGHEGSYGGAMLLQSKTVMNMYGGTIRKNHARVEGGAVCLYSQSTFNMRGGVIKDNTSDSRGGGLKFNAGTTGNFTGGTATGNYAAEYGGFFNAHGIDAKITMKNMKVYGNECKNYGGGIAITWNAVLDMDNCEFYDNTAGEGGAMHLAHKTTCYLDNVKVHDNFSNDAGGAFYLDVGNNLNFTNVEIVDNESTKNGGAIYTKANLHLKDCLIDGNVSGKDGGAIATSAAWTYGNLPENTNGYVGRGQGLIIENTTISNNTCVGRGGGAFMAKKNWNTIIDSTFTGNVSGETGSALFVGDDLDIRGMTVTGNTSKTDGYAVYFRENSYDGQSYMQAVHSMGGNVIVKDNKGGDMYLCEKVSIGNTVEGYGKDTYINVGLSDGVLTNRIFGEYNYEGGEQVYVMTYGDRSYTDPEVDTARVNANMEEVTSDNGNTWLYIGVGVFAVAVVAAVVLIVVKKKKAAKPAETTQE